MTLCASVLSVLLMGQITKLEKKGDRLYERYNYSSAIEKYLEVKDKSQHVKRNLSLSYYHLGDYKEALNWSKELMSVDNYKVTDVYNHSYLLRMNKSYEESEEWMKVYHQLNPKDNRSKIASKNKGHYTNLLEDKKQFELTNLRMNTSSQEFGPNYYQEYIVFASSRDGSIARVWGGNNKPYLNFYKGKRQEDLELEDIREFYNKKNKKWHEGPVSFNEAGDFMVFTRNNYEGESSNAVKKLMLFTSEYKDGKWSEGKSVPFNSSEYSVGQASLSPDGKTMYFTSDMPGGYGSTDIYKSEKQGDTWTVPVNLGPTVNTEGKEMFPYIDDEGKRLFFASDGHYGLGGLDLFMTSVMGSGYGVSKNLGYPINTNRDDFALIIDKDYKTGYFSSNRKGGRGSDDIYSFRMLKPFGKSLRGVAKNSETGEVLSNVEVSLYDKNGDLIDKVKTDSEGRYDFLVDDASEVFGLKFERDGELLGEMPVKFGKGQEAAEITFDEKVFAKSKLWVKVLSSQGVISNVKCIVKSCEGKEEVYYTDAGGAFSKSIYKKVGEQECFSIRYEKLGYESKEVAYNFGLDRVGQYNIEEQLKPKEGAVSETNTNTIVGENAVVGTSDATDNVLSTGGSKTKGSVLSSAVEFKAGDYNLTESSKGELDKLTSDLAKNPDMRIKVSVHTDCVGSKKSNQILSDNRAKAIVNYLRSRVSNPSRITGKGYGETQPLSNCDCESKTADCHKKNQRTEITVVE